MIVTKYDLWKTLNKEIYMINMRKDMKKNKNKNYKKEWMKK
nr:hypothetical protein [Mycoplasmopsis bovis]